MLDLTNSIRTIVGLLLSIGLASTICPSRVARADDSNIRGRELAARCAGCHTADGRADFAGGRVIDTPDGGILSPNITPDRVTGIGNWSSEDLVIYLKTGRNSHATASGLMAAFVANSSAHFSDRDLQALAAYLAGIPAVESPVGKSSALESTAMRQGVAIYRDVCSGCHGSNGAGVPGLFPPLNGSAMVKAPDPASMINVIAHGERAVGTDAAPTTPAMPSFSRKLDDHALAMVMTFVRAAWNNAAPPVSEERVSTGLRGTR